MIVRFKLVCAATLCMLVVGVRGEAQAAAGVIVTITKSGYVAGPPPKADPQGTWSVPAAGDWKYVYDCGTVTGGSFTLDITIGVGGGVPFTTTAAANGSWGPNGQETLKNPLPANTYIRARLQKKNNGVYVDQGNPAYLPIP